MQFEDSFSYIIPVILTARSLQMIVYGSLSIASYIATLCNVNVMHTCALPVIQSSCENGEARLADGSTKREGRVEVCMDGEWSSVCGKKWDYREARTVCRQLKFPNHGESHTHTHSFFYNIVAERRKHK